MQEFFKSKLFKILLVVVAFLVGLITFEIFSDNTTVLKSTMRIAIQPVVESANFINNSVSGFFDEFFKNGTYKEENVLLKKEISRVRKNLVELDRIKLENEQLKKLLNFKTDHPSFNIEIANFISHDPDSLYKFTIDVGANNKIPLGATVLTDKGLVGKITKVDKTQSTVSTILSLEEKIPAVVNLKQEKGLISGEASLIKKGLCLMSHLPKATKTSPGDLIYTSGFNNTYPDGIVIGTIEKVKLNQNGISREAIIKPTQDLNNINEVMVIKNYLNSNKKNSSEG